MHALQMHAFPHILIPGDKNVNLGTSKECVKVLNTVTGLFGLAVQALKKLKKQEFPAFDSLATDCSCHLRALMLAHIGQELASPQSLLKQELKQSIQKLKAQQLLVKQASVDVTSWCQKGKNMKGELTPIIQILKNHQEKQETTSCTMNLHSLLQHIGVHMPLSHSLAYAIHAYALTIVKAYDPLKTQDHVTCADATCCQPLDENSPIRKETTQLKKLTLYFQHEVSHHASKKESGEVNNRFIEKEIYLLAKKQLTELSVQFILQETQKLDSLHIYTVLNLSKKEVEGKWELPDYYSLTGVFQVCLQKQIPVLLKIKKCLHAHRYQEPQTPFDVGIYLTPQNNHFEISTAFPLNINGPVIVVEGKRSGNQVQQETPQAYIHRLLKSFNFLHLCQLDGAQHKQYTSDALNQVPSQVIPLLQEEEYTHEAQKLDFLRQEAQTKGCAFSNQSLLIMSHIFADTLQHQFTDLTLYQQTSEWLLTHFQER